MDYWAASKAEKQEQAEDDEYRNPSEVSAEDDNVEKPMTNARSIQTYI